MPSRNLSLSLLACASLALPATAQDTQTMSQVVMHLPDDNGHVLTMIDVPVPTIEPNEILVEVHAAAINGYDHKIRKRLREGDITELAEPHYPVVYDASGVVVEVGANVEGFEVGDNVMAYVGAALSQYTKGDASIFAHKPDELSHAQAASLPVAGICAIHALHYMADIQEGQSLLIHGGAGGVGHFAIQLAKNRGATVYTTVSSEDIEFVRQLGADHAIDYKTQKFEDEFPPVDIVMELIGGEVRDRSIAALKPDGYMITFTTRPEDGYFESNGIRGDFCITPQDPQKLAELASMIVEGSVTTHIDKVFPLDQFREAFDHIEHGDSTGKVIISVK
ncbi:MAG: NADP-dependent oxidoreductase [Planctomycetota bacterium]|jgi:NADPH:quinone reductase-like Zn-dependent oxidoreductase